MDQAGEDTAENGAPSPTHPSPADPWAALAADGQGAGRAGTREPPLRLAWPPVVLVTVLILLYAYQSSSPDPALYILKYGFIPAAMMQEGWYGLITAPFVHGSWGHVLTNSAFALAFGSPLARRFGSGPVGGSLFFLFFLVCGLAGNLGYALVHPNSSDQVVGASGGIAAFLAATSRLLGRGPGLAPLTSPPVVTMAVAIVTVNLVIGLFHISGGVGSDGAPVAWETHIAGYVAGLLLIGLFDRAAGGGTRARFQPGKD